MERKEGMDDTPQLLAEISAGNTAVRYLHRTGKKGLASAVVDGFSMARGEIIAVMDADLQHPPSLLPKMLACIDEGADVVLPSRYIAGGRSEGLSIVRTIVSKGARLLSQAFLSSMRKISDPMSGYFMISRGVIDGVVFNPVGWKILLEVLTLGNYRKVVEISYSFEKRNAGESKLSSKVMWEYLAHIVLLIIRSERERRFYLFACIALSGVAVDMLVFSLISSNRSLPLNLTATFSALTAMTSNYLLNRRFTWNSRKRDDVAAEFLQYSVVCVAGIGIKNLGAYLLMQAGAADLWCNFGGILAASVWNYTVSDRWVFKEKPSAV